MTMSYVLGPSAGRTNPRNSMLLVPHASLFWWYLLSMAVMAWFKKERKPRKSQRERLEIPPDAWEKCDGCGHIDIREKFEKALNVCPECGRHRRISAEEYVELLTDQGTWRELYASLRSVDPLGFENYADRLTAARKKGRRRRRDPHRNGQARWAAVQSGGHEFRVHGRVDGFGGGREDRATRAPLPRKEGPSCPRLHLGWRPDAGRRPLPHADGQDLGGHRPAPPRFHPVHLDPHRSHHRRRLGVASPCRAT